MSLSLTHSPSSSQSSLSFVSLPCPIPHPLLPPDTVAIVNISNNTEIYAGTTVVLTCIATGIPDPSIEWLMSGKYIQGTYNTTIQREDITFVVSYLEIYNSESSDAGDYTCVASVPQRNDTASVELTVLTIVPDIVIPPNSITLVNGTYTVVRLACLAVGAPLPNIIWTVSEGDVIDSGVTTSPISNTTIISTVDLGSVTASDEYFCIAESYLGNVSATATITVQCMCKGYP